MIVSLNQSGNDRLVVQIDRLGRGSRQCLHFSHRAESHDSFALDGHGFIGISRGVGNDAAVIHADNFAVHQNRVGPAHFFHQSWTILRESQGGDGQYHQY